MRRIHRALTIAIARTVLMGCRLLEKKVIEYAPVKGTRPQDVPVLTQALDLAYKGSGLAESPQHEGELRRAGHRNVEKLRETGGFQRAGGRNDLLFGIL